MIRRRSTAALTATVLFTFTASAQAAQQLMASEGYDLSGVVSAREVTRLSVRDDRIASMARGAEGFNAEISPGTGDLFIRPERDIIEGPINLFVITEKGHTYKLFLMPEDIPAEQIILIGDDSRDEAEKPNESSYTSYKAELSAFLTKLIRDEKMNCVWEEIPDNGLPDTSERGYGLYRIATVICPQFTAEDVVIIGDELPVVLRESEIAAQWGDMIAAVWLENEHLNSFGMRRAILVRGAAQ